MKSGWYLSSLSRFVGEDPDLMEDEDTDDLDKSDEEESIIEDEALLLADEDILDAEDDEDLGGVGAEAAGAGGGGAGAGWALASSSCPSALASPNKNINPEINERIRRFLLNTSKWLIRTTCYWNGNNRFGL